MTTKKPEGDSGRGGDGWGRAKCPANDHKTLDQAFGVGGSTLRGRPERSTIATEPIGLAPVEFVQAQSH